jgi:large subunit ribosomal protein L10
MPITKNKKTEILQDLINLTETTPSIVFVSFQKVTANEQVALRKKLKNQEVGYRVAKKSLIKKALEGKSIQGNFPELPGEIAFSYGKDLLAPAREMYELQKEYKGSFAIVGGVFEGVYKTKEEMLAIATIPGREVLLSQIAFLLKSPLQRLAIAVNEVAKSK